MATVFVCDGSPLVREGFRRALAGLPGIDRVVALPTADSLIVRWPRERPDLALIDARAPGVGGVETVRRLMRSDPSARILILSSPDDEEPVAAAVAAGARGYLQKSATRAEVRTTVAQLLAETSTVVVPPDSQRPAPRGTRPVLTERELEVLAGMCEGRSNAEIGKSLFLSEDTVKTHARRLFKKLGAVDRAHAVALGYRWGLVR